LNMVDDLGARPREWGLFALFFGVCLNQVRRMRGIPPAPS